MTKQELNRDIKKLWRRFKNRSKTNINETEDEEVKKEWLRLWCADKDAEYMHKEQLKAMLCINQTLRIKPLHLIDIYFKPKL